MGGGGGILRRPRGLTHREPCRETLVEGLHRNRRHCPQHANEALGLLRLGTLLATKRQR